VSPSTDRTARRIARALCAAALGWSAAIWLAPVTLDLGSRTFASATWFPYALGGLVCHQRPERSFTSGSIPWPVCARCAGLYLSAAAAIVVVLLASVRSWTGAAAWRGWRVALLLAAFPSGLSWLVETAGWWLPDNATRATLAAPFGLVTGALLASIARKAPQPL
jgi:uncharacterized membrane protein